MGAAAESRSQRRHSLLRGQPSIAVNGKTLYWDSDRPDGLGDFDIWMATRASAGSDFRPAVNVGPEVNGMGPEFGAAISQNEEQTVLLVGQPGNIGQIDIWVVERKDKSGRGWSRSTSTP